MCPPMETPRTNIRRIVSELTTPLKMRPCKKWPSPGISQARNPINQGLIVETHTLLLSMRKKICSNHLGLGLSDASIFLMIRLVRATEGTGATDISIQCIEQVSAFVDALHAPCTDYTP